MNFKNNGWEYTELSSSQESLDEFDKFSSHLQQRPKQLDFQVKLAEFPKHKGWGARHTLVVLGFLGYAVASALRINLSIAIVEMVKYPHVPFMVLNATRMKRICPENILEEDAEVNANKSNGERFDWDAEVQGVILGAFFISYSLIQVPAGILADKIGGKWPFCIGLGIASVFCLLTPLAARVGKEFLILTRFVVGLGEGISNPAMQTMLAKWLPPLERCKLGSLVYTGLPFGIFFTTPVCGLLISSGFLEGWPSVFYVFGASGLVWFLFWIFLVHESPAEHPRIEAGELDYIRHAIGSQISKHKFPTPWCKMFTSLPVLALLVIITGQSWGSHTLLTELPTYMKTALHFNITQNGFLTALPHFMFFVVGVVSSWFSDYLREENIASTTTVRKIFNAVGHWIPAIGLVYLAYSGCNRIMAVTLLVAIVGINGVVCGGYQMNHVDLSPNNASFLMGITSGVGALCGIVVPYVVGYIIEDGATLESWHLIFLIAAGVFLADALFYLVFGSGEEQSWNRPPNLTINESSTGDHVPLLLSKRPKNRKPPVRIVTNLPTAKSEKNDHVQIKAET